MLSEKLQQAINAQINLEFSSFYAYVAMAAYFESLNLPGFAHWCRAQSQEEVTHAMKLFDFVTDRNGRVMLHAIGEPQSEFGSPLDAMEHALQHEQMVTASIHQLYELAVREQDYPTQAHLHWFIEEQVEEEKQADLIVQHLKLVGEEGVGLLVLDRQLAERRSAGAAAS